MRFMRKLITIQLLFITILLSGCWSAKEIHDLAIVNTMGIDINDSGEFEITTVIVKPSSLFPKSAGGTTDSKQSKYLIETATGQTILDAMSKLSKSVPGSMYVGHTDVVVFGEKAAREKMVPALDFISRANEFRPNIFLLVTKGKAADIITTSPEFSKTIGLEVKNLTNMNRFIATKMVKDISKFREALTSNTTDPVTAVLTSSDKLGIQSKGEVLENHYLHKEAPPVISLDGTAVFKKGNLTGFLDEEETRGLLWINGDLKREIIVLKSERNKNQKIGVLIRNSKSQLTPVFSGNKTKMIVKTVVEADIGDITCPSLHLDSYEMDRLNQQLEELISKEETSVLAKAQKQWQTDIFGFGKTIYRNQPRIWDLMAPNWRNGGLKDLEVNLMVKANISRYGLLKDPSNPNESR